MGKLSRALNEVGSSYAKTQREIIAHLTEYEVDEEVEVAFRVRRKDLAS